MINAISVTFGTSISRISVRMVLVLSLLLVLMFLLMLMLV